MRSIWPKGLWLLAVGGAFAGGYFVEQRRSPNPAPTTPVAATIPLTEVAVAQAPAAMPDLVIPSGPATPLDRVEINRHDQAFKAIEKQLGINTGSLLDEPSSPKIPPIILVGQKKEAPPPMGEVPLIAPPGIGILVPPRLPQDANNKPEPLPDFHRAPPPPSLGPQTFPRMVLQLTKTRQVVLDCDVRRVGISGIAFAEIWAKGEKGPWVRLERTAWANGPLSATLPNEGRFGLKVVLESQAGLRSPEPIEATVPDLLVEADITPPKVELHELRGSPTPGVVNIGWTTTDKNPAVERTRVEYSTDSQTWHMIEGFNPAHPHVVDKVRFACAWTVPQGIGHRVKLRVTVEDRVGNRATATSTEHVSVDMVIPEGQLKLLTAPLERGPMPRLAK